MQIAGVYPRPMPLGREQKLALWSACPSRRDRRSPPDPTPSKSSTSRERTSTGCAGWRLSAPRARRALRSELAQSASVTPHVRRAIARRSGGTARLQMPTIHAVAVAWPPAGDWFVHMPLSVGDTVLLVVCDRDPARWRVTGELSDPIDSRLHHLSHAVAIPGG